MVGAAFIESFFLKLFNAGRIEETGTGTALAVV
jgi:hypothetical protein